MNRVILITILAVVVAVMQFVEFNLLMSIIFGTSLGITWFLIHNFVIMRVLNENLCNELVTSRYSLLISIEVSLGFIIIFNNFYSSMIANDIIRIALYFIELGIGGYLGYKIGCQIGLFIKNTFIHLFFVVILFFISLMFLGLANSLEASVFLVCVLVTSLLTHLRYHNKEVVVNHWFIYTLILLYVVYMLTIIRMLDYFSFFGFTINS